ncbi:phage/plasmid primase, P4 family [Aquidulcibacter sp.]|uniref:phage/plasmid primase, P4 family n=1 Tax=Aquidulcibacter sp. TaxID=2052990 RepID=UPI0025C2A4D2|nr:phage/plasmid primase, P4 family [Aquidulcibacter sp.]MCA3692612.1 PriCT-2 domain-containing protein [Aquidulcibacter sp.]
MDLKNLASFNVALAAYLSNPAKWAGLGFALIDGDGVGALDFDGCVNAGSIQPMDPVVQNAILQVQQLGVYLEVSPSGNGLRALGSTLGFKNMMTPFEAYCRDRFVTITGDCLSGAQAWVNLDPVVNSAHPPPPPPPVMPNLKTPQRNKLLAAIAVTYPPPAQTPAQIQQVQSALKHLNPDVTYPEWRKVICALHSTSWTIAEDLARDWSAGGDAQSPTCNRYDQTTFDREWSRLKPNGFITIATLFHKASQNGWKPPTLTLVSSNTLPTAQQNVKSTNSNLASATSPPPSKSSLTLVDPDSTGDIRNGQEFANLFKDKLIHAHETNETFSFEPWGWTAAGPSAVSQAAQAVVRAFRSRAAKLAAAGKSDEAKALTQHAIKSSMGCRLREMVNLGWTHPSMSVPFTALDKEPHLLGVQNGVVNLQTGNLEKVTPSVLVTKRAGVPFDPNAVAPEFLKFLATVQPDPDVRRFLQQVAGLFLWGDVIQHHLYFFYGAGANGKSTYIELIQYVMGEYAHNFDVNSLLKQTHNSRGATPELAKFRGVRLAHTSEIPIDARIDEERVKNLTGGNTICARDLYEKPINFQPSHSLVMVGNHLPEIRDVSAGMRRRFMLIGFNAQIPLAKQNPHLLKTLIAEGSGVLNWMIDGLHDYNANGLKVPQVVRDASKEFMEAEDLLGQWLGECCNTGAGLFANKKAVYGSYRAWADSEGHFPMSSTKLTRQLAQKSIKVAGDKRNYLGINLKSQGGSK